MSPETLARMLSEMSAEEEPAPPSDTQLAAQVMDLREYCARYVAGNPFKVGDLVTPSKAFGITDAGMPHIVLQILDEPAQVVDAPDTTGNTFGRRLDMRVLCCARARCYAPYWAESWQYEKYTGPMPEEH